MHQRTVNALIALAILWNLHTTLSASEIVKPEGHSPALNLLLEMLVKSNQDLADKFDKLQDTVSTHATTISELRLQHSSGQTLSRKHTGSGKENKHCDVHICETLANQIKWINDTVSNLEENQTVCKGMDKALEIVDELKDRMTILSRGISSFKGKQLSDERLFNRKIENMENEISGLEQNHAKIMSILSERTKDLEILLSKLTTKLSDMNLAINQSNTKYNEEIASVTREQAKNMNQLNAVQEDVNRRVADIFDLGRRVLNIEERYETIKDEIKLDIRRDNKNGMVVFSARVSPSYSDIQPGTTIIFSSVKINIGQGYNPKNGEFSAPVAGVYVFYSNILTGANKAIETRLVINGKIELWLYSSGGQHMGPGSNLLGTHLEKGDIVKMMKYGPWGTKPFYIHHYWSTFSGFLLVPDV